MADRPLHLASDAEFEAALRSFAEAIEWPVARSETAAGPDLAATVRARLEGTSGEAVPTSRPALLPRGPRSRWRPVRVALLAAVLVLLALAVLAGAAGLGLPGLRLLLGGASVSPPPSLDPSRAPATAPPSASAALPGWTLALGERVPLEELDARAGFAVTWPSDPLIGPPDAAYIDTKLGGQVALVWASRDGLPDTLEPGIGLVVTEFQGTVDNGFFSKSISSGTHLARVQVGGRPGYWISGESHFLFYEGPNGAVHDPRRWIGDALLWAKGSITYRLETSLGKDAAIRLAESMP